MVGKIEGEEEVYNPLIAAVNLEHGAGSVRELVINAVHRISPWDLPEDPAELKSMLNEAVDYAVSVKSSQRT